MKKLSDTEIGCVCGGAMVEIVMGESSKIEHMKVFEKLLLDIYNKSVQQCMNGEPVFRSFRASTTAVTFTQLEECVTSQVRNRINLATQMGLQ
jgi:hypothetical protein